MQMQAQKSYKKMTIKSLWFNHNFVFNQKLAKMFCWGWNGWPYDDQPNFIEL
jgi:hypothetical protein